MLVRLLTFLALLFHFSLGLTLITNSMAFASSVDDSSIPFPSTPHDYEDEPPREDVRDGARGGILYDSEDSSDDYMSSLYIRDTFVSFQDVRTRSSSIIDSGPTCRLEVIYTVASIFSKTLFYWNSVHDLPLFSEDYKLRSLFYRITKVVALELDRTHNPLEGSVTYLESFYNDSTHTDLRRFVPPYQTGYKVYFKRINDYLNEIDQRAFKLRSRTH